jgi:hypothetical protein
MLLPKPRGSFSEALFAMMTAWPDVGEAPRVAPEDDADAAVALWALHELHYRGFEDVEAALEWHPSLAGVRHDLEAALEHTLRSRFTGPVPEGDLAEGLFAFVDEHDGPSIARHVQTEADEEQVLDLLRWRSVYHLKESDPTAWVVPRLPAAPQAALMELQYDEYGVGNPHRVHAHLFARGMAAAGLRPEYGIYVDEAPTSVLEQNNAMSLFGLHRRLRGAALGHLAAFEASSSLPSRRMVQGLARLGMPQEIVDYYAEHVEADAVHEQLAVRTICAALVEAEPELRADVFLGAFTCLDLEDRVASWVLDQWAAA